jgi:serpin B
VRTYTGISRQGWHPFDAQRKMGANYVQASFRRIVRKSWKAFAKQHCMSAMTTRSWFGPAHLARLSYALLCSAAMSCELVTSIDSYSTGGQISTSGGDSARAVSTGGVGLGGTQATGGTRDATDAMAGSGNSGLLTTTGGTSHVTGGGTGMGEMGGANIVGGSTGAGGVGGSTGTGGAGGADLVVAKSTLPYEPSPSLPATAEPAVIGDLNDFGFKVFRQLAPKDQDFVMSPLSGYFALVMSSAGALGKTADEMKSVLFPDLSASDAHPAVNLLGQRVRGYARAPVQETDGEKQVELTLANDLFAQRDLPIEAAFLDTLAINYDCGVQLLDFIRYPDTACDLINTWVSNETAGKIDKLVSPGAIDVDTRLVLVNTLYLNAAWKEAFDPRNTQSRTFHGFNGDTSPSFMRSDHMLNYATGTGWTGIDIPYHGGALVFTAILPDADQFETVKAGLNAGWLSDFDAKAKVVYASLTLPKLKLLGPSASWMDALQHLGMVTLFDSELCNLRGISTDLRLHVKDVLQQVYMEVNESGTEAAAATGVFYAIDMAPQIAVSFDRPFLFVIREPGGPILFAGQVVSP